MATTFTAQRKTEMYQFFAVAFSAAPGTVFLQQLREAVESGLSTQQIVNIFTTKREFTDVYSPFLANQAFATLIVNNVIKSSASDAAKTQAVNDIVAALGAGLSRGDVVFQVFNNLASITESTNIYFGVAQQFRNQVVVASYYTEQLGGAATDVRTLQSVIRNVTNNTDVSTPSAIETVINSGTINNLVFELTSSVNRVVGSAGNDQIFGNTSTFQALDSVDGGTGVDVLTVLQADPLNERDLGDVPFAFTTNVEVLQFDSGLTGRTVFLGDRAEAAGLNTLVIAGGAGNANLNGFDGNMTVRGNVEVNTVSFGALDTGVKAIDLGSTARVFDRVVINDSGVSQVRVTFTSAEIGNGSTTDGNDTPPLLVSGANVAQAYSGAEDGGLAVRFEREDVNGLVQGERAPITNQQTHRVEDEGVVFTGADFDVRDLGTGAARGVFPTVALGTQVAEVITAGATLTAGQLGVALNSPGTGVYVNAGLGNDTVLGSSASDFLVGGFGDDSLNSMGGGDTLLGGAGNDQLIKSGAGLVNFEGGAGDDVLDVTGQFNAADAVTVRDSLAGGDGRDTLVGSVGDFNAAAPTPVGQAAVVTGIEILDVSSLGVANFETKNISTGVDTVVVGAMGLSGQIGLEAGSRSVLLGSSTFGGSLNGTLTLVSEGSANNDSVLVANRNTLPFALNGFNGRSISAEGAESLTLDSGGTATSSTQTVGTLTVNASDAATDTRLVLTGLNAVTVGGAISNTTRAFQIDASGLTTQLGNALTVSLVAGASAPGGTVSILGSGGNDRLSLSSSGTVVGGTGNDFLAGSSANDLLEGGTGNDELVADAGVDTLDGGDGDDTLVFGSNLSQADVVRGGAGRDTLAVSSVVSSAQQNGVSGIEVVRFDAPVNQSMANFAATLAIDTIAVNTAGVVSLSDVRASTNTVRVDATGSAISFFRLNDTASDTLTLSMGAALAADTLSITNLTLSRVTGLIGLIPIGFAGEEVLNISQGLAANGASLSILNLVAGAVTTINVSGAQKTSIGVGGGVDLGTGARTVSVNAASATGDFSFNGALASQALRLNGAASVVNSLTGGSGADSLVGGNLADLLAGGTGADTLIGGAGVDTYSLGSDTVIDRVTEAGSTLGLVGGAVRGFDLVNQFVAGTDVLTVGASTSYKQVTGTYSEVSGIGQFVVGAGATDRDVLVYSDLNNNDSADAGELGVVVVGVSAGTGAAADLNGSTAGNGF